MCPSIIVNIMIWFSLLANRFKKLDTSPRPDGQGSSDDRTLPVRAWYTVAAVVLGLVLARSAVAQQAKDDGIPVTDPLVVAKCSACHHKDEKGNLTRISWERTTPEGWEEIIKRMVRLNGLTLNPEEARAIVKSLSTTHGLAPDEARPVMYIPERRMIDESFPTDAVRQACASCHPLGRARSWRRSKEEWNLLVTMHRGYFTVAEQSFRGSGGRNGPQPPEGARPAVDQAIEYLTKDYGLASAEWSAWRARMRAAKLSGRWLVSGYQAGKGKVMGEMQIEPGASDDEFTANVKLTYVKDGSTVTKSSKSVVYTGYSWRGKTPDWREVMWVAPDQASMEGRWFWGAYDEFGIDVKLKRAEDGISVLGVDSSMIRAGSTERVRIFGDHFSKIAASDLDFGSGVSVKRIADQSAQQITVEIEADAKAIAGKRDVAVRGAVATNAIAMYHGIDRIKVAPESAIARLGGVDFPKGFQQFEAIGYDHDVELGPVDAQWSIEEFYAVYGDDDKEFVGSLNSKGLFTPNTEGPNPKRRFSRNNYGDVWVVASYNGLKAKSYLVVAVPLYVRWDQPEVVQ
jgi:quinohemoprotein amine dehydrogenase